MKWASIFQNEIPKWIENVRQMVLANSSEYIVQFKMWIFWIYSCKSTRLERIKSGAFVKRNQCQIKI